MMDQADFDIASDDEAANKIIGTFFGTSDGYFNMRPRNEEDFSQLFDVGVLDEEIKALYYLINQKGGSRADDRQFAIEFQFKDTIMLSDRQLLCAILPEPYIKNKQFVDLIVKTGASVLSYPIYPLRKDFYYYAIYHKLDKFYKLKGYY